jgi:nucleoside-specific outer membrane channel protein Tsx
MSYRIKTTWNLAVKFLWEDRLYYINFVCSVSLMAVE